jgi:peptide/nickel transport system permease protein
MLGFFARRALTAAVLLLLLTFLTFLIFYAIPAQPGRILVGEHAPLSEVERANERLGADRPIYVQYGKFLWRLLHGDLGSSWPSLGGGAAEELAVAPALVDAAGVTASLVLGGAAMLLLIAIPLGALAAASPGSRVDRLATVGAVAGISLPPIVVGLLLQTFVGRVLGLAPESGYCNLLPSSSDLPDAALTCSGPTEWARHLVLPWITFALFFVALYMGMMRARVSEVLREPYIRTARAKGASEGRVLRSHALRNAILPIVTMLGMDVAMAVTLSIYVETVYDLPGVGRLALESLSGQSGGFDLPFILGVVLFTGTAVIVLNLVIDLLYGVIDPTIKDTGSRRRASQTWVARAFE